LQLSLILVLNYHGLMMLIWGHLVHLKTSSI